MDGLPFIQPLQDMLSYPFMQNALLASLLARLAWAHEYQTTGSISAWFQSLRARPSRSPARLCRVTSASLG